MNFLERLKLFLIIFKYLLIGKADFYLYSDVKIVFGCPAISMHQANRNPVTELWEMWHVTFDGEKAIGYIDGVDVETINDANPNIKEEHF
jgi:hypothetical protein